MLAQFLEQPARFQLQQGGYQHLFRAEDGSAFSNTGSCVSYTAQGGVPSRSITFSNIVLNACNNVAFGYTVDGQGQVTECDVTDPNLYVRKVLFNDCALSMREVQRLL